MNVVDSSAWIEYFVRGGNAPQFRPAIVATDDLVLPTIVLVEVGRWLKRQSEFARQDELLDAMLRGRVVPLDTGLARAAAELGIIHRLPLADSIVYATAQANGATLWTQDGDFEGLPDVEFRRKGPQPPP